MLNICKCSFFTEDLFKTSKNSKCRCEAISKSIRHPIKPNHAAQGVAGASAVHILHRHPHPLWRCHTQNTSLKDNNFLLLQAEIKLYWCCHHHKSDTRRKIKGSTYPCLPYTWASMSPMQLWKHKCFPLLTLLLRDIIQSTYKYRSEIRPLEAAGWTNSHKGYIWTAGKKVLFTK